MTTRPYILIPVLLITALSLAGCGKTVSQKVTEQAIERATNGSADVDVSSGKVTVNTNGTSWQVGESVDLPSDFPTDLYIVDGATIKSAVKTAASNAFSVVMSTTKSVADVKALYDSQLKSNGWTSVSTASFNGSEMIVADKGNRSVTVTIGAGDESGVTAVSLTTLDKNDTNTATP